MRPARQAAAPHRPALLAALVLPIVLVVAATALDLAAGARGVADYEVFDLSGRLLHHGRLAEAYALDSLMAAQVEFHGRDLPLPFTYPPQIALVTGAFAALPLWAGYLGFTLLGLAAHLLALRRLAGPRAGLALLASLPAAVICARSGQSGFLIGAGLGWFALALRAGGIGAAWPLALLAIKPHLLAGVLLLLLLGRRWAVLAVAALAAAALVGLALALAGPGSWPAFLGAVAAAGTYLEAGIYPLSRMVSVYAAALALGLPPGIALAGHGAVAGGFLILVLRAWWRGQPGPQLLALALLLGCLVAPYAYDYDLQVLAVALALVAADLAVRARPVELAALLALGWIAGGAGFVLPFLLSAPPSVGAFGLVPFCGLVAMVLARPPRPGT